MAVLFGGNEKNRLGTGMPAAYKKLLTPLFYHKERVKGMPYQLENGMVASNQFGCDTQAKEPKVIDICEGCSDDILQYEDAFRLDDDALHNDMDCITRYIQKHAENL